MNTKRALYQPVGDDKAHVKNKRKPLAQGRLLQSKTTPTQFGKDDLSLNISAKEQLGKENVAAFLKSVETESRQVIGDTIPDVRVTGADPSTPRKDRPHTSFTQSPRAIQPSRSLDISDSDSEIFSSYRSNQNARRNLSTHHEVLVLDASHDFRDTNNREVSVEMHYKQSPVAVVRHTSRIQNELGGAGDVMRASQITQEQLPHIPVIDSFRATAQIQHSTDQQPFVPTQVASVSFQEAENVRSPNPVKVLFHDREIAERSDTLSTNTEDVEAVRALETSGDSATSQDQSSVQQNTVKKQAVKSTAVSTETK